MGSLDFMILELEVPDSVARLRLPDGVNARLQELLDKQDSSGALTDAERSEAEGLVDLTDFLSLLHIRMAGSDNAAAA
jgi:hypothetical protein